jgi:hypothetical protein
MVTNKLRLYLLLSIAFFLAGMAYGAFQSASAATSFSTPSPFKQGGTGNTQIIPVYPTWSVNIPLSPPQSFTAASSTTGGSLTVSNTPIYFQIVASNGSGTTTPSTELSTTTTTGSSQIIFNWTPVPGASAYGVFFSTTSPGAENAFFYATTTNQYDFTSTSSPIFATPPGFPSAFAVQLTNATSSLSVNNVNLAPFATTTVAIGGNALGAGGCSTATSTLAYNNTVSSSTVFMTTAQKYPGSGVVWQTYALDTTQFVTEVCALAATTPVSTAYNVRAY